MQLKAINNLNKNGFTIIELIVVIAIVAVLAGIVLVNVQGYVVKSKVAAIKADMSNLSTLAVQFQLDNGKIPGFCNSPQVVSIASAIAGLKLASSGSGIIFLCNDFNNGWAQYARTPTNDWTVEAFVILDTTGITNGNANCTSDKWFADSKFYINGVVNYWCIDSGGIVGDTYGAGNSSTCACQ